MTNIIDWAKRRPWLAASLAVGAILVLYLLFGRSGGPGLATSTVTRGTVTQLVSVTGKIVPAEEIELAFEKSGKIVRIAAKVGDRVSSGQVLVQLDSADLAAQLAQANANILAEEARLDQLVRGSRPEDIEIARTALTQAEQDLEREYAEVYDALQDAYTKADDAVRSQIDDLFTNDEQVNAQLTFTTANSQQKLDAENGRVLATSELIGWQADIRNVSGATDHGALENALSKSTYHANVLRTFLNALMDATSNAISLSSSTLASYKTAVNTARTQMNSAATSLTSQTQAIAKGKLAVTQAKNQLDLKLAGTAPEEIEAQRARVRQAQASAANIQAQLAKTTLRSSISGTVTKQDGKVGQIVTPNSPIAAVISDSGLEIEANVPEVDIGRVALARPVTITLDALPGETFRGSVATVDPAETVVEGVATYRTTVTFETKDARVKSGMTANMEILVDEHTDALTLPQRAVTTKGGKKFVTFVNGDGTTEERAVTTGLRGQNGEIEILSGLAEGDTVLRSAE